MDAYLTGDQEVMGVDRCWVQQHSFKETDGEIFFMVIPNFCCFKKDSCQFLAK